MYQDIWINLPVENVAHARQFFQALGFSFNPKMDTDHSACLIVGEKNAVVMLFHETLFQKFVQNPIADTHAGSEILLSISVKSRAEVDNIAKRAKEAGGHVFGEPEEVDGWMYGCGFSDLDGHRWNALFMDYSLRANT